MSQPKEKPSATTKAYVILQRDYIGRGRNTNDNVRVIAVKLTRAAAERVRDSAPGTFIEKHTATKK